MKIIKNERHGFSRLSSENGTEMKKSRINRKRRGFTLMELIIALVLMSFVTIVALATIKLSAEGYIGTSIQSSIVREDAQFVTKLNKMIRESTAVFTIPEKSFNKTENLTEGWNYLGVMKEVNIPADVSRTGKELTDKTALVYIEYAGTTEPQARPGCNVIDNGKGAWFYQKILGYSFTDQNGRSYDYDLTFNKTHEINVATQQAAYELTLTITDENGKKIDADGAWVNVKNTVNSLNAIQVVYNGGDGNPAKAIAFRPDFMPTYSESALNEQTITVVMMLDYSPSMVYGFDNTEAAYADSRINALRKQAAAFIDGLQALDGFNVNVVWVPFSYCAGYGYAANDTACPGMPTGATQEKRWNNAQWVFNLNNADDRNNLNAVLENYGLDSGTNIGDAMRVAYYKLQEMDAKERGKVFTLLISDGEMNSYSIIPGATGPKLIKKTDNIRGFSKYLPDAKVKGSQICTYLCTWQRKTTVDGNMVAVSTTMTPVNTTTQIYQTFADTDAGRKQLDEFNRDQAQEYATYWGIELNTEFKPEKTWYIRLGTDDWINSNAALQADQKCLEDIFVGSMETIDVSSEESFRQTFTDIRNDIDGVMWAFNGPDIGE